MPTEEMRGIPFDSKLQTAEDGSMYEDREIFSADIAEYFGYLSTNGICIREGESLNNQLKIAAGTAGVVVFNPGAIKIQGRMGWMEEAVEKQTEAGGTKPRYDTAVIELNLSSSERRFIPKIIKGVEADSPVPPTLTQTANIYQLGLANIYRAANSTALGTITDTRSDSQRCGISKVAVPNVPDDVINLWASQYPGVVSLADILTKISTEGLPVPFGGTGKTTAAEALKALGGISLTKLWENANTTSAFPNQKISLDLSGYDYVVIVGNTDKGSNARMVPPVITKVGSGGIYQNGAVVSGVYAPYRRYFGTDATGVNFDAVYPSSGTDNNIPCFIFGIKGVI